MASNEDRLRKLSERFSNKANDPAPESKPAVTPKKEIDRRRHSLYLDKALVARADNVYKEVAHKLYPTEISKSDFLEACLKFALEHIGEIEASLTQS